MLSGICDKKREGGEVAVSRSSQRPWVQPHSPVTLQQSTNQHKQLFCRVEARISPSPTQTQPHMDEQIVSKTHKCGRRPRGPLFVHYAIKGK